MSAEQQSSKRSRRSFLLLFPLSIIAGVFSSLGVAAVRFLRPRIAQAESDNWLDVAPVDELPRTGPLLQKIRGVHVNGWAISQEEHQIYILPGANQVLSAVCPHEGCEVNWEKETNRFSCPCHESYFAADGSRISGPARRGLDPLPSRIEGGQLQVQYQSFENNATERVRRT
jgi:Rieske Fe-S protein